MNSEVPRLELPEIEVPSIRKLYEEAEEIRRRKAKIRNWVGQAVEKLEKIEKARAESQEIEEMQIPGEQRLRIILKELLSFEYPPYRKAAWLGLLSFYFGQDLETREELRELLLRLSKKGYLRKVDTGHFWAYGDFYALPSDIIPEDSFHPQEIEELKESYRGLFDRVEKKEAQRLKDLSTLSEEEFLDGKEGTFTMEVPEATVEDSDTRETKTLYGGTLALKNVKGIDGRVRTSPVEAAQGILSLIERMKRQKTFLLHSALSSKNPPWLKDVRGISETQARDIRDLWYIIQRGLSAKTSQ